MTSAKVFGEISALMETLQEVGKKCCVKEGHVTLSVMFTATRPDLEKEKLGKILATIVDYIPEWPPPPDIDYVDIKRITVEMHPRRVDIELELPTLLFPAREAST